jgi:uncharacterized protein YegL
MSGVTKGATSGELTFLDHFESSFVDFIKWLPKAISCGSADGNALAETQNLIS